MSKPTDSDGVGLVDAGRLLALIRASGVALMMADTYFAGHEALQLLELVQHQLERTCTRLIPCRVDPTIHALLE